MNRRLYTLHELMLTLDICHLLFYCNGRPLLCFIEATVEVDQLMTIAISQLLLFDFFIDCLPMYFTITVGMQREANLRRRS